MLGFDWAFRVKKRLACELLSLANVVKAGVCTRECVSVLL